MTDRDIGASEETLPLALEFSTLKWCIIQGHCCICLKLNPGCIYFMVHVLLFQNHCIVLWHAYTHKVCINLQLFNFNDVLSMFTVWCSKCWKLPRIYFACLITVMWKNITRPIVLPQKLLHMSDRLFFVLDSSFRLMSQTDHATSFSDSLMLRWTIISIPVKRYWDFFYRFLLRLVISQDQRSNFWETWSYHCQFLRHT